MLKQPWISSEISVREGLMSLLIDLFQSLTIWLNSVATSVGSINVIISSPVYVCVGLKFVTCLFISWIILRFVIADLRSFD